MLRKKAIVNGGLNLPDRNSQGPGLFNTGVFADTPVKRSKEKAPEREREEEEAKWADTNLQASGILRRRSENGRRRKTRSAKGSGRERGERTRRMGLAGRQDCLWSQG